LIENIFIKFFNFSTIFNAALYLKENVEDYLSLLINSSNELKLNNTLKTYQSHIEQNSKIYISKNLTDKLQCFQALKKKERTKRIKEIFQNSFPSLQESYCLKNLYVKNLNPLITEREFKDIFSKFGLIVSCKLLKRTEIDRFSIFKTEPWVFGFVCLSNEESAKKAKYELNNSYLYAKPGLKLYVDYFESKKQRQFNLQNKHSRFKNIADIDKKKYISFEEKNKFFYDKSSYQEKSHDFKVQKNKGKKIHFRNRLNVTIGNDFDFIFAKFRHKFGIIAYANSSIIDSETENIFENYSSFENDFSQFSSPVKADNSNLLRELNKCVLNRNKFDLVNENKIHKNFNIDNFDSFIDRHNDIDFEPIDSVSRSLNIEDSTKNIFNNSEINLIPKITNQLTVNSYSNSAFKPYNKPWNILNYDSKVNITNSIRQGENNLNFSKNINKLILYLKDKLINFFSSFSLFIRS